MPLSLLIDQIADAIGVINSTSTPARRLVGGGVVVDARGRVLVCYSDFAYQGWHFPKGGLDEGESSLAGAIREVEEESGGVIAGPFSGDVVFALQPGRVYREPLGFGSSRAEAPEHRTSDKISLGAVHLLAEAAREARIDLDELERHRYEVFDSLVGRGIQVAWVTVPTYHLLVYESGRSRPTSESQAVEWHTPADVRNLRPPGKPHGKPRLGGAARTLLERSDFAELVERAKAESKSVAE
ncbi:MAG TPA: NUDIX hydrolase [Gemmataceae bacterium]|nr:NUDIX hydrolase [Gemmataceae bacterium]